MAGTRTKLYCAGIFVPREVSLLFLSGGVTKPENLAEDIKKRGVNAQYIDKFEDIAEFLKKNVKEGDIVFTMGAGDVVNINKLIVE